MKPMLPTLSFTPPVGDQWVYETKYDGFRAFFYIGEEIKLMSRNGKDLLPLFPEASHFFEKYQKTLTSHLPVILDGELTILMNPYKSDFAKIQRRGRLRKKENIQLATKTCPASFLAFDMLQWKGKNIQQQPYLERKKLLQSFTNSFSNDDQPVIRSDPFIQFIPFEKDFSLLWNQVIEFGGEGVVAKHIESKWIQGLRTNRWIKLKNWKKIHVFITAYDQTNGYFHVSVYDEAGTIRPVGLFKNGLSIEEQGILQNVVKTNAYKENERYHFIRPGVCVELLYLEWYENQLREPYFSKFLFHTSPQSCTFRQVIEQKRPRSIEITHPKKQLWKTEAIKKQDYIDYLTKIYPFMSPFLKNRTLTVIRYPHGMFGEGFFQKNCPSYAPHFVDTYEENGIRYILCNNLQTFIWLGNQLAIEFHIPFQTVERKNPSEIVIDLDPPSKAEFDLAKEAAFMMKKDIFDPFGITTYLKVSGKRGLHLYIPLSNTCPFTWEDTQMFSKFIGEYVLAKNKKHFTTERLKKHRNNRLYIDYVQFGKKKTVIAPFSVRGSERASVATPIFWKELHKPLEPDGFSMSMVLQRLTTNGNPFEDYFQANNEQPLREIISYLKDKGKSV